MQSANELHKLIARGRPDLDDETIQYWVYYLQQLKGCSVESVTAPTVDESQWLKARNKGIGGSEIAGVVGRSKWTSAKQIWVKKTDQFVEEKGSDKPRQNEAARWGNLLETTIAEEWSFRENEPWIHIPVILHSDEYPFMFANIDGFVLSPDRKRITRILEIKTTSAYNQDAWEFGPIPEYYTCQVNWYCMITGLTEYTIVCLVGGQHLFPLTMPVNEELQAELKEAAIKFWNVNVLQCIEPEVQISDTASEHDRILALDNEQYEPAVYEDDETESLVELYCNLRTEIGNMKKMQDLTKAKILTKLTNAPEALTQTHVIRLASTARRSVDFQQLEVLYPEAYEACVSKSVSAVLRVK